MSVNKRIVLLIEALKKTNNSFASGMGMRSTAIDYITKGVKQPDGSYKLTKPSYELLEKIITTYNVNCNWLFTDNGEMFGSNVSHQKETKIEPIKNENMEKMYKEMLKDKDKIIEMLEQRIKSLENGTHAKTTDQAKIGS